jgi:demethylmenaquinone methyltransferase/2-methoxy-6-polyprenyl-1,4-benzoquinol methylase
MLEAGRARRRDVGLRDRLAPLCADAENLPLPDQSVDALTIAFGIRNVTHVDRALVEARRVLKIGGRFFCLEFSHPATEALQRLYDLYSFNVIPWLGEKVANDRESYQYLVESIRRFPGQEAFAAMIGKAGFSRVKYENLSAGIVAVHSGWRI